MILTLTAALATGYTNSLLALVNFATSQIHEEVANEHDDALVGALFNLRSQAESQHRDDRSAMVVLLVRGWP